MDVIHSVWLHNCAVITSHTFYVNPVCVSTDKGASSHLCRRRRLDAPLVQTIERNYMSDVKRSASREQSRRLSFQLSRYTSDPKGELVHNTVIVIHYYTLIAISSHLACPFNTQNVIETVQEHCMKICSTSHIQLFSKLLLACIYT